MRTTTTEAAPAQPLKLGDRAIRRVVVIRESDADRELLEGLLDQSYRLFADVEGVSEALALGLRPYEAPETVDGAMRIGTDGHRAVCFSRGGTLFIIWGGSAASADEDGENHFTSFLARTVRQQAVGDLYCSTFSRLVRSSNQQGTLRAALQTAGTRVHIGSHTIDMTSEHGRLLWDVFCMVFSLERDAIERRLVIGQIHAARRKVWMGSTPPLGYQLAMVDGERRVVVDEDPQVRKRVRKMIEILGTHGNSRSKLDALAHLDIEAHVFRRGGRRTQRIDQTHNPASAIRRLNGYLEMYRDGIWIYERKVPELEGIEEIAGFQIREREDANGAVERIVAVPIEVGLPEGGWAPDRLFEAWDVQRQSRSVGRGPDGGGAKRFTKPLTGVCNYRDGAFEYKLMSDGRDGYKLRRRRFDPDRQLQGWDERKRGSEQVASFNSRELHRSLAAGIREAIMSGNHLELIDAEVSVDDDGYAQVVYVDKTTRQAQLERHLAKLDEQLDRAVHLASSSSKPLSERYHQQAQQTAAEKQTTEDLLTRLDEPDPAAPATLRVHGRTLLDALDALEQLEASVEQQVATAVSTVLHDLRWELSDAEARWTVDVYLPTDAGLAVLSGVSGALRRYSRPQRYGVERHRPQAVARLVELLCEGADNERLAQVEEELPVKMTQPLLREAFSEAGLAPQESRLAGAHPSPSFRQALVRQRLKLRQPADFDPAWVAAVDEAAGNWPHKALSLGAMVSWAHRYQVVLDALADGHPRDLGSLCDGPAPKRLGRLLPLTSSLAGNEQRSTLVRRTRDDQAVLEPCSGCGASDWLMVKLPEVVGGMCRQCCRVGEVTLTLDYLSWKNRQGPVMWLRQNRRLGAEAWRALPTDEAVTLLEWGNRCRRRPNSLRVFRDELLEKGLLESAGLDQRHQGKTGLAPMLYRLTEQGRQLRAEGADAA